MPFETQDEPAQRTEICGAPARMPFEAWGKLRYERGHELSPLREADDHDATLRMMLVECDET